MEPYIPEGFVGAEIGVFKGHFSRVLFRKNPKKLYLVDPWYRFGSTWQWVSNQNPSTIDAFNQIMFDFDEEIRSGVIEPIPEYSVEFLKFLPNNHLDFLYLYFSHSYEVTPKARGRDLATCAASCY